LFIPVESRTELLWRMGWGLLAAVHAPVLLKSSLHLAESPDWLAVTKWAAVLGVFAFFALKVAGLRLIRVNSRPAAAVVLLVACGLAHGQLRGQTLAYEVPETAAVLATAGVVTAGLVLRRRCWLSGDGAALVRAVLLRTVFGCASDWSEVRALALPYLSQAPPRGPPLA
jgi:hypothetical protein